MGKLESGRSHLSQKLPNKAFCMITGIMHCKATQKVTGFSSHFFLFTYGILNDAIAVLITSSMAGSVADVHLAVNILAVNIRKVVRSSPRSSKSETPE